MPVYLNPMSSMKYNNIFIGLWLFLYGSIVAVAQKEETDDLGTQEVTVVKSYSPSLKSVFKIQTLPEIDDSLFQKKIKVDYTFESIPVLSTFVPNKATPLKLQRQESSFLSQLLCDGGIEISPIFNSICRPWCPWIECNPSV